MANIISAIKAALPFVSTRPAYPFDKRRAVPNGLTNAPADVVSVMQKLAVDFKPDSAQFETPAYDYGRDTIHMPPADRFYTAEGYRQTALHELTHWTRAKHRLNRGRTGGFGGLPYALEEVTAEFGSAMLEESLGDEPDVRAHAEYINNWDQTAVRHGVPVTEFNDEAVSRARKAVNWILSRLNIKA